MTIEENIRTKLAAALRPERLEVVNESHLHAGHHHLVDGREEEFDGTGETHFRVRIVSPEFSGMSRVDRHRRVNELLKDELAGAVHALAVEPAAPGEPVRW